MPNGFDLGGFLEAIGYTLSMMSEPDPYRQAALYTSWQDLAQKRRNQQAKHALLTQDRAGMSELSNQIRQAMRLRGGEGAAPTGTEGLRPVEQTGFGAPEAFQRAQQQIDPATLMRIMGSSPSAAKMVGDPQMYSYFQSLGLMPISPQTQVSQQNAETAQQRAGIMEQLAGIRQQQADTSAGNLDLRERIQAMNTALSKLQGEKIQAQTANLGARTGYTLGITPLKQQVMEEDIKAMQAKYPTLAPMAEAKLATEQERPGQIRAQAGLAGARQKHVEQRTADAKAGKPAKAAKPTQQDKLVEVYKNEIRQLQQIPAKSGRWGFGGTNAQSVSDQVEMMKLRAPTPRAREAITQAYLELHQEGLFGEGGPVVSGQKKVYRFDSKGNLVQ